MGTQLPKRMVRELAGTLLPSSMVVWRGSKRKRQVALTFDDGPDELTPEYLDVLGRFGVKATFFVVGELCEQRPDLVARIAAEGHELAGHGYTHRPFPWLHQESLLEDELRRTAALLPGQRPHRPFVRPPHGALNVRSLLACARAGFTTVLWSFDSGDWCTSSPNDVSEAVRTSELGPGAIVLLHEGQHWTLGALPSILEHLLETGHEPVTVGELLSD